MPLNFITSAGNSWLAPHFYWGLVPEAIFTEATLDHPLQETVCPSHSLTLFCFPSIICHNPNTPWSFILFIACSPPPCKLLPRGSGVPFHSFTSASENARYWEVLSKKNHWSHLTTGPQTPNAFHKSQRSSIHGKNVYNSPRTSKLGVFWIELYSLNTCRLHDLRVRIL